MKKNILPLLLGFTIAVQSFISPVLAAETLPSDQEVTVEETTETTTETSSEESSDEASSEDSAAALSEPEESASTEVTTPVTTEDIEEESQKETLSDQSEESLSDPALLSNDDSEAPTSVSEEEIRDSADVSKTWGGDLMGLTEAKRKTEELIKKGTLTGTVTVAVIDTGINKSHPWFQGRIDKEHSRSFLTGHSEKDYDDQNGHGSHVAGIIAQNTPENIRLMVLQALDENKNGSSDAVSSAIRYAADNGASIINLSLGVCRDDFEDAKLYSDYVATLQSAISYAKKKDCLIVTSAGNNGNSIEKIGSYPAGSSDVITVSAITDQKEKYEFSNTGSAVDFCAPGEDIYSAWKGGSEGDYVYLSGTSMAAPFVSAVLTLIKLYNTSDSSDSLLNHMAEFIIDLGVISKDNAFGDGMPYFLNGDVPGSIPDMPFLSTNTNGKAIILTVTNVCEDATLIFYKKSQVEGDYQKLAVTKELQYIDEDVQEDIYYEYYVESDHPEAYRVQNISYYTSQNVYYYGPAWISFSEEKFYIPVNEKKKITCGINPIEYANSEITYISLDPEIATVNDEGEITGLCEGHTQIKVKGDYTQTALLDVTVVDKNNRCGEDVYWSLREEDSSLIIYGNGAMYDDLSATQWPWYSNPRLEIQKLIIEDGVTELGANAFDSIHAVDGVEGMKDVVHIHERAFEGFKCSIFQMPSNAVIDDLAFENCEIEKVIIDKNVKELNPNTFSRTFIHNFIVDDSNTYYCAVDGILFNKDQTVLICFPTNRSDTYQIPDTVEALSPGAFRNCNIEGIEIPDTITEIPEGCFAQCDNLKSVELPGSILQIGDYAFENCDSLADVVFPEGLETIGAYAFSFPNQLTKVILPSTVRIIGGGAFSGSSSYMPLKTVTIPASAYISSQAFSCCEELSTIYIEGNTLAGIGQWAFADCPSLTDIYFKGFKKDFLEIESSDGNDQLYSATLHIDTSGTTDSLTWHAEGLSGDLTLTISGTGAMPDFASPEEVPWLDGMEEIKHVIVEDGVTHIGSYAFYLMKNLEDVTLPSSVKDYGYSVFRGDPNLEVFRHDNGTVENQLHIAVQYLMALYSGIAYEPEVAVRKGAAGTDFDTMEALTEGTDYTVTYSNTRNIGEGTIVITFLGDYTDAGSVTIPFIVASELLKGENIKALTGITVNPERQTYTGAKQTPAITVKSGRWTLKNGVDYKLNTPEMINAGEYAISAEGIGAYSGNEKASFSITSKRMDELSVSLSKDSISLGDAAPVPTVTYNGRKLTDSKDYSVSYKGTDQVGTAEIIIEAKGSNYSGSVSKSFTVTEKKHKKLPALILSKTKTVYNGKDQMPSVTIKDGGTTLKEGTDYTLKMPASCKNVGTYRITATGIGDYEGTSDAYFMIEEAPKTDISTLSLSLAQSSIVYDGRSHLDDIAVYSGSKKLKKDTDYLVEVSPSDCTKAGTYRVTVTGVGDYKGTKTLTFTISKPSLSDLKDKASLSQTVFTYDGKKKEPEVFITGLDPAEYEVTYTNNTKAGTGTAIATARESSNYTGSIRLSFTITKDQEKALVSISLSQSRYEYDGTAKRPAATVKSGSTTLKEGRDYTLAYSEGCKDSGTYQVTATGIGGYKGSVTVSFTISAKALPDGSRIALSSPKVTYNGQEQRPEVTIEGLVYGRDYTVRYSDNVEPGEGHITITGLGNYQGTTELTFTIEEPSEETTVTTTAEQSTETTSLAPVDDRQDTAEDSPETTEDVSASGASDVAGFLLGTAGIVAAVCAGAYFWFFLLAKRKKDSEEAN